MVVNTNKTKVITFRKAGRIQNNAWFITSMLRLNMSTYLWVVFTSGDPNKSLVE